MLRAVSNQLSCLTKLSCNTVACNRNLSCSWYNVSSQTLESGGLSSPVDTQKGKTFTIVKAEGDSLNSLEGLSKQGRVNLSKVVDADHIRLRVKLGLGLRV